MQISQLRDLLRFYNKTYYELLKRGPRKYAAFALCEIVDAESIVFHLYLFSFMLNFQDSLRYMIYHTITVVGIKRQMKYLLSLFNFVES